MSLPEEITVEPLTCPSCGWFGMSDDCRHNECPNCGQRVVKDKEGQA